MRTVLVERHLLNARRYSSAANLDLQLASLARRHDRHISGADWNVQRRTHRPAPHLSTRLTIHEHRITGARKRPLLGAESDELSRESLLFLAHERIASDEFAFLQLYEPAEVGFEGSDCVVDVGEYAGRVR